MEVEIAARKVFPLGYARCASRSPEDCQPTIRQRLPITRQRRRWLPLTFACSVMVREDSYHAATKRTDADAYPAVNALAPITGRVDKWAACRATLYDKDVPQ